MNGVIPVEAIVHSFKGEYIWKVFSIEEEL
jgi:hypothetical protein